MNLRHLISRQIIINLSKVNGRVLSSYSGGYRYVASATASTSPSTSMHSPVVCRALSPAHVAKYSTFNLNFSRYIHTAQQDNVNESLIGSESESEIDVTMNDFLSRFVWMMRQKLREAYPDCDKNTIDGMLLLVVEKVVAEMEKSGLEQMIEAADSTLSQDFSEDLWRTVWEVSNVVLQDMEKEKKKEKMKAFLQSEEVKEMYRFAGEVGIRGDMLRELRFKWAREKMEESEFYQSLERLRNEATQIKSQEEKQVRKEIVGGEEVVIEENNVAEDKQKIISLPKRHGKMKYKIYGLDLSDPKWAEVADKIYETGEVLWPQEPKSISGQCKLVTDKILSLQEEEDPAPLLREWISLLHPSRVDWINLLDKLKQQNSLLYFKVAEIVLGEESFQTNIRDYSKLIDGHARENRLEDAERILKKMNENGILPDVLASTILVHMYSKSGHLDRAKEAYENFKTYGFQPDVKIYNSMIMAYVNACQPKLGDSLIREMEARDIKPTKDIYMALLRSFAQLGDVTGAQRISTTMQLAGFQPSLESCTLLVEAFGQASDPDQARNSFDHMIKLGHKPDDRCTASMLAAYEKKNLLDKALNLLLELEKGGFEPGVTTYTVLIDWLSKMKLVDEAEQMLGKIAEQGEAPPFKVHISLCDMYSRVGAEKKALQALGVLESKKEQLGPEEFERIIKSLLEGRLMQDAQRMYGFMKARGFVASSQLEMDLMSSAAFSSKKQSDRLPSFKIKTLPKKAN